MKAKTEQARAELYAILEAANFDVNQPEVWLAHASIRYTYCLQEDVKELEALLSDKISQEVIDKADANQDRWQGKDDMYWFARLSQEVGELGSSLVGDHEDPPEWELTQIASIAINWLRKRERGPEVIVCESCGQVIHGVALGSLEAGWFHPACFHERRLALGYKPDRKEDS